MKTIVQMVSILVVGFVLAMWSAWVMVKLWEWFVVATFGVPMLEFWQAYGLVLLVRFLTSRQPSHDEEEYQRENTAKALIASVVYLTIAPAFVLVFGAIVHALM